MSSLQIYRKIEDGIREGFDVHKFGRNPNVDNAVTFETIWNGGGIYTGHPTGSAETLEIFSGSANDTAAGSGAQTVKIYNLLDENFNKMPDVTVTLNGVTPVSLGAQTYSRCSKVRVLTAGSTGANEGALTLRHTTTTTNIMAVLPIGYNSTMIVAYTIPNNRIAFIRKVYAGISGKVSANCPVRLLVRPLGETWQVQEEFALLASGSSTVERDYSIPKGPYAGGTDVRIDASSDTNNTAISASFDLVETTWNT